MNEELRPHGFKKLDDFLTVSDDFFWRFFFDDFLDSFLDNYVKLVGILSFIIST